MEVGFEIAMAVIMVGGVVGVFVHMRKHGKGIGPGIIQFLALVLIIPAICILTLEGRLSNATTGALFGTVLGFILGGLVRDW